MTALKKITNFETDNGDDKIFTQNWNDLVDLIQGNNPSGIIFNPSSYSCVVYIKGTTVYAVKKDGTITYTGTAGTNDSATINAAINALTANRTKIETVKVVGNFTAEATINVPSYTRLDLTEAIITANNSLNTQVIQSIAGTPTNIEIIGGVIDGNQTNQTSGTNINISGASYVTIRGVTSQNAYSHGIRIGVCSNFILYGNTCINNGVNGRVSDGILIIQGCSDGIVSNNICNNNGRIGITVDWNALSTCSKINIFGNECNTNSAGIWVEGGLECKVNDNICNSNTKTTQISKSGIVIASNSQRITVVGNTCESNTTRGIDTSVGSNASDVQVIGNHCYLNGAGISAAYDAFVITGNECYQNGNDGIVITSGAQNGIVSNNICKNNGTVSSFTYDGITIEGTSTGVIVVGNRCYDNSGTPKQYHGVNIQDTADNIIVSNNDVRNNVSVTASVNNTSSGTNIQIYNNNGYNKLILADTGLTANRTFTFPDISDKLATVNMQDNDVVVFILGSTYYAFKHDGSLLTSSSTAETVLSSAFGQFGDVYVANGTYTLSAGFTGFNLANQGIVNGALVKRHIRLSENATIQVPNGYTGYLYKFGDNVNRYVIEGGNYGEAGTPSKLWTAFYFNPTTVNLGTQFNEIKDCTVYDALDGIKFQADQSGGYINSNDFYRIEFERCVRYINFVTSGSSGWNQFNYFEDLRGQPNTSANDTTYGVKNLSGIGNMFVNCVFYDFNNGGSVGVTSCELTANSDGTTIIGGAMTHFNFTIAGTKTRINDRYQGIVGETFIPSQIYFNKSAGTTSNSTTYILSDSANGNLIGNVPTGKGHYWRINGSNAMNIVGGRLSLISVNAIAQDNNQPLSFQTDTTGVGLFQTRMTINTGTAGSAGITIFEPVNFSSQTATNFVASSPTLTTPTIADFTNANHNHQNTAGGGTLSITGATTGTLTETRGGTNQTTYTLGDILYSSASNTLSKLAGNITTAKQFLTQTGTGTISAAPSWGTIADGDLPATLTGHTITGGTFSGTIAGTPTISGSWTWSSAQTIPTISANNLNFDNATGTATNSKTQIFTDAQNGNLIFNAPTTKGLYWRINGGNYMFIAGSALTLKSVTAISQDNASDLTLQTDNASGAGNLVTRLVLKQGQAQGAAGIQYSETLIPTNASTVAIYVKAGGAPADTDFASNILTNGMLVYDSTNSKLWVRTGVTTWKGVALA